MYHVPFLLKIESPCDCGTVHMPIDSRPEPCLQRICRKLSIFIAHFADTVALYCGMGAMYMPQYYPRHPEQIGNHQWSDVWLDPRLASRLLRPAQQARGPLALERAARLSKSAAPVCEAHGVEWPVRDYTSPPRGYLYLVFQDERDLDVTSPGILTTTRSQQENEGKRGANDSLGDLLFELCEMRDSMAGLTGGRGWTGEGL